MKNLIILAILSFSMTVYAQDSQLFENTWYLQKLTIDGQDIIPPRESNTVEESTFSMTPAQFDTGYCDFLGCSISFNNPDTSFDIINLVALGGNCTSGNDLIFADIYYNYFFDNGIFSNPFAYEITNTGGILYLEFTNANGDNALYANQLLAAPEQTIFFVSIYPNPAKDSLTISLKSIDNASVTVYNILGVAVLDTTITSTSNTLNMETLSSGVYLISVTANDGRKQTLKLIKE